MVASGANHGLQTAGQMPIFSQIERLCADRTMKQVWKYSGKAQHPNFKVTSRDIQRTVVLYGL